MKLTVELIKKDLKIAANIIKECYSDFNYKELQDIRISNARSYWATIWPGKLKLIVSNCFEDIEGDKEAETNLIGTLIHELIHTIPGCDNHGFKFLYVCKCIALNYPQYGRHLKRSESMNNYSIKQKPIKYQIKCSFCGYVYNYHKKPKWSKQVIETSCRCGACNHENLKLIVL